MNTQTTSVQEQVVALLQQIESLNQQILASANRGNNESSNSDQAGKEKHIELNTFGALPSKV